MSNFSHLTVLLRECVDALAIRPDGIYVDATAGGGGHSFAIASVLTTGRLIAIDQDASAIAAAGERLAPFFDRVQIVKSNFSRLEEILNACGVDEIDGFLADLGTSAPQLLERGGSYRNDAPLDMRMDQSAAKTAYDVVNTYSEEELKRILFTYGEERYSARIAANIVRARAQSPIKTTGELAELIKNAIPAAAREGGHHPAKRSFQAIRIEVNGELDVIEPAIRAAVSRMRKGGRLALISFHSLEDRIVKQTFADLATGCTCPRTLPVCVCGRKPQIKLIGKKPILPSAEELEVNPRSRSAKLRVAEKL